MRKACPKSGRICEATCTACKPQAGMYGTRNPQRNLVSHNRWARALKRAQPVCQRCGSTEKLDAHHGPNGGVVLCNACHVLIDPYARKR